MMVGGTTRTLAFLLAAAAATPAAAEMVIAGRSAQALRCAAYIGMAAQYGYDDGVLTGKDRELMTTWSVLVLQRWVPLAPQEAMAAYRTMIGEMGTRRHSYDLIAKHADWCVHEFTPAL